MNLNQIFENTKAYFQKEYESTLMQRLTGGEEGVFLGAKNTQELDRQLRTSDWKETTFKGLEEGCKAYVSQDIPEGHNGIAYIHLIPDDALLTARTEQAGSSEITYSDLGAANKDTWLIVGPLGNAAQNAENRDIMVIKQISVGKPMMPTRMSPDIVKDGEHLTKTSAIAIGFDRAVAAVGEKIREVIRGFQERTFSLEQLNEKERTPEICKAAIERDGMELAYVPHQTQEICMSAVEQHPWARKYVIETTPGLDLDAINHAAVKGHGSALYFISDQKREYCLEAVANYGEALNYVKVQDPEICLTAVQNNGLALQYVNEQTPQIVEAAVRKNGEALQFTVIRTPEIERMAVQNTYLALPYVREQTEEICLIAVRQNGDAIEAVANPTPAVYLAAIETDPTVLTLIPVEKQTQEMIRAAIERDGTLLRVVEHQTPEICLLAVENNPEALQYADYQTPEIIAAAEKAEQERSAEVKPKASLDIFDNLSSSIDSTLQSIQEFLADYISDDIDIDYDEPEYQEREETPLLGERTASREPVSATMDSRRTPSNDEQER